MIFPWQLQTGAIAPPSHSTLGPRWGTLAQWLHHIPARKWAGVIRRSGHDRRHRSHCAAQLVGGSHYRQSRLHSSGWNLNFILIWRCINFNVPVSHFVISPPYLCLHLCEVMACMAPVKSQCLHCPHCCWLGDCSILRWH